MKIKYSPYEKCILTLCLMTLSSVVCFAQFIINPRKEAFMGDSTRFQRHLTLSTSNDAIINNTKAQRLKLNINGGISLTDSAGYFILGTPHPEENPFYQVFANPSFWVRANGEIFSKEGLVQLSDETLKKNIRTIANPLEKIGELRGVSYSFKDESPAVATMSVASAQEGTTE